MKLDNIATEIKVTGSKTLGYYCSFYIGSRFYKKKVEFCGAEMFVTLSNKLYSVN